MGWIRIDDCLPDHPRVSEAIPEAMWLYVAGLCYCNRLKTDGKIRKAHIARLTSLPKPERLTASLIEVGLWIDAGKEVEVFNYLKFQRSASEREAVSQQNATNGRSGGLAKAKRVAKDSPEQPASEPVAEKEKEKEEEKETPLKASSQAAPDDLPRFQDFWTAYPRQANGTKPEPKQAQDQWAKLKPAQKIQALESLRHYIRHLQQNPDISPKHAFRYLRDRSFEGYASAPLEIVATPGGKDEMPPSWSRKTAEEIAAAQRESREASEKLAGMA